MKRKLVLILVSLALLLSMFAGCTTDKTKDGGQTGKDVSGKQDDGGTSDNKDSSNEDLVNNTHKTGYPIVEDKITLDVVVVSGSHTDQMQNMVYFDDLEELTNIHLNFEHYTQGGNEKINLMFSSRDFPDIIFSGANDKQIMDAAAGGDILPLNDLMDEYAPNWVRVFEEMPYARKVSTMDDGMIYGLPYIHDEDVEKGLRDLWLINVQWLDELDKDIPTTTEEYRQVLTAFKENAGKGSIPKDVIPWYFRHNQYTGGSFDIFGSFGILVPSNDYLAVEDGEVKFQAINPDIKEPIKYLHELYKEGLIPSEAFTDDWDAYMAKTRSEPAICGVMHSFHNPDMSEEIYKAMAPIKGPGVDKPLFRQQTSRVMRNKYSIFSSNKYPEASMRLADTLAEKDWSIQGKFGIFDKHIEKTENGGLRVMPGIDESDIGKDAPLNRLALALTGDIFENFEYDGERAIRERAFEMYKPYIAPLEDFYPPVVFNADQIDKRAELSTDILGYISETIARWIVDGGIDEEWDGYVNKINEMGGEEYIKIHQDALDNFNKN